MREDQTPDAQGSVQLHCKSYDRNQVVTVSRSVQEINLSGGKIQSVDLSPLSSCASLQTLRLSENRLQKSSNTSDEVHVVTEEGSCILKM